jgi:hypothetical protein
MSQRFEGNESSTPSAEGKTSRRLTLLEKLLTVLGAAFALTTAVLGFLTVQGKQATHEAQSSAASAGADLSSLQTQYSQLKSQNAQLQSQLSTVGLSSTTAVPSSGAQLGAYTVDINFPYSIPLGPTKPTQSQFSKTGLGDLGTAAPADHLVFVPINGNKMLSLPGGSTPTYQACANGTVFANQADSAPGTSFCIIEKTGKIAGVTLTSAQSSYVVLTVTVWQNELN